MTAIGTGYDLSASQFSPDGRVFQVEYAGKAVENSGTAIAMRCQDGVVFAVEKLITSKLYETTSNNRIFSIDRHIGCAVAGLIADSRALVKTAQDEAQNYRQQYGNLIPLKYLKERVSMYMHAHTLYSFVRPFGSSMLVGSWDEFDGPQLYCLEPSGYSHGYLGVAIGKAKQSAKTEIEKLNLSGMKCEQLIKEAAKIIYMVHDEIKDKQFVLELSWVGEFTKGKHETVPTALREGAEHFAKEALRPDSDSEDENI